MIKTIVLLCIVPACAFADEGVDFSMYQGAPGQDVFNCFHKNDKTFLIIQIWGGGYQNYAANWQKAKAAGTTYVNVSLSSATTALETPPATSALKSRIISQVVSMVKFGLILKVALAAGLDLLINFLSWKVLPVLVLVKAFIWVFSLVMDHGEMSSDLPVSMVDPSRISPFGILIMMVLLVSVIGGSVRFGGYGNPNMKQYQGTTNFCGTSVY